MASHRPDPGKHVKHAPGRKQTEHGHRPKENDRDTGHLSRDKANPAANGHRMVREEQR